MEHIVRQANKVDRMERCIRMGQEGMVLWFTGLSGAGKSTIAVETERRLTNLGYHVYLLDGDNIRLGINSDLGFSNKDREENIRRVAEIASLFQDAGIITLVAFITPFRKLRASAKEIVGQERYTEIFVKAALNTCVKRDPKGLYAKNIGQFTGISSPFEEPESPDIVLDTDVHGVEDCVDAVVQAVLQKQGAPSLCKELEVAKNAACAAGQAILEIYDRPEAEWGQAEKADCSPQTAADRKAHTVITEMLRAAFPSYAILSEEGQDDLSRLEAEFCFIVDPLDGTKEFLKRNGQFTVNIALVHRHQAVMGVIYAPVSGELYWAERGKGAFLEADGTRTRIHVSDRTKELRAVISASHGCAETQALMEQNHFSEILSMGSSLKGCLISKGAAEVYYRFNPTMEWDTAAMQCIVEESGGIFRQMDGSEMRYNRVDSVNRNGFYAINRMENQIQK